MTLERAITIAATVIAIVTSLWHAGAGWQAHVDEDRRRDEKIRVLERIAYSEHPEYAASIAATDKEP